MEDYIICLEKAKKILAVAFLVFWILCLVQVDNNKILWAIGLLLPFIPGFLPVPGNKTIAHCIYLACTVIYIIVSVILTHRLFEYVPHLACCICLIAESLISEAIRGLDK